VSCRDRPQTAHRSRVTTLTTSSCVRVRVRLRAYWGLATTKISRHGARERPVRERADVYAEAMTEFSQGVQALGRPFGLMSSVCVPGSVMLIESRQG